MWSRYTSQTDQRLEADVSLIARETEPWDAMRSNIVDQRGRIEVKASDFEGRTAQNPLYRATFILAKAHQAVDWFNGLPLGQTQGNAYAIHSHHIFPQSLLYQDGWDAENHVHRQAVNEIANRAFLTATTNIEISNTEPAEYLPMVRDKFPGALVSQFIPIDPELWKLDRYSDFLEARRDMIARKLNEFMDGLITEPEATHHRPIAELIGLGESYALEFKSTLQWDVVHGQQNNALRQSVLKSIAAFMNSEGGTLVIGVEDDGNVLGLDRDLKLIKGSLDRFEQLLVSLISDKMGVGYAHFFKIRFEPVDDKQVCVVDLEPARDPVFVQTDKGTQFFVRVGNTTRSLDGEEQHDYLEARAN